MDFECSKFMHQLSFSPLICPDIYLIHIRQPEAKMRFLVATHNLKRYLILDGVAFSFVLHC